MFELLCFDVSVLRIIYLSLLKWKLSFFFFPLLSLLMCILPTSPIFETQFVKNCEGSKILRYMQANRFACHSFMDASRMNESLLHVAILVARVSVSCAGVPSPSSHGVMPRDLMTPAHTCTEVHYRTLGT